MMRYIFTALALCLGLNAPAMAATLKGTAKNVTTGKPAVGDEVIVMAAPAAGGALAEIGRGKTDTSGRFQLTVADTGAPRLVRVIHQGVVYQHVAPEDAAAVEVTVFDAAQELEEVTATWDVQRLQTAGEKLQVVEEISVRNASKPPRTLTRAFEIKLPPEAQVVAGRMRSGDGQPVESKPVPGNQKGRYSFPAPLVPGDSHFGVAYLLPYKGEAAIEPKIFYPLENFLVVLPKSMKFRAGAAGMFQSRPGTKDPNVQEMVALKSGLPLSFRVSGTGSLLAHKGGEAKPGPLGTLRWTLLGGLAVVVTAGLAGFLRLRRKSRGLAPASRIAVTRRTRAQIPGGTPSGVSPS